MSKFDMDVREHFWWRHFSHHASLSGYLYGLRQIGPSERKKEELGIAYATAVDMPVHLDQNGHAPRYCYKQVQTIFSLTTTAPLKDYSPLSLQLINIIRHV
ncbi:MAG: hypothetical protein ACSLEN_08165 [Candidatus Malihini olakiniferum]